MNHFCFGPGTFLLPPAETDLTKWACIACDQFTSQPEYWHQVEEIVSDAPSAYRLILPECRLSDADTEIPRIHDTMLRYEPMLSPAVKNGFILTERTTESGSRIGLVGILDLEQYDYRQGNAAPIRATEETIQSRIPARMRIREGACLETSHVLLLMNDKENTILPELFAKRSEFRRLYDFETMMAGGHLAGWAVEDPDILNALEKAFRSLRTPSGLIFAVGDGNHSLASAKAWWEKVREGLSDSEKELHPARYAMVELVSITDPAMLFAPIHRVLFGVNKASFLNSWRAYESEMGECEETIALVSADGTEMLSTPKGQLPVAILQRWLDSWLASHPKARLDYVHGDEAAAALGTGENSLALLLPVPEAGSLFHGVEEFGSLPRKTFSMGMAEEKRYYLECRKIIME